MGTIMRSETEDIIFNPKPTAVPKPHVLRYGLTRSLEDWAGMAKVCAAKARLHMCTGHASEAVGDLEFALKVWI